MRSTEHDADEGAQWGSGRLLQPPPSTPVARPAARAGSAAGEALSLRCCAAMGRATPSAQSRQTAEELSAGGQPQQRTTAADQPHRTPSMSPTRPRRAQAPPSADSATPPPAPPTCHTSFRLLLCTPLSRLHTTPHPRSLPSLHPFVTLSLSPSVSLLSLPSLFSLSLSLPLSPLH